MSNPIFSQPIEIKLLDISQNCLKVDVRLEHKTFQWLVNLLQDAPPKDVNFDEWVRDGTVLCKAFNALVFNSVPFDLVDNDNSHDIKVGRTKTYKNYNI